MTKLILLISFKTAMFFTYLNCTEYNNLLKDDITDQNKAVVTYEKDLYFFVESKPVTPYIELGNIKASLTFSGQYNELKTDIVKKCLKNYPGANGLIFNTEKDCSQAIAIKFK